MRFKRWRCEVFQTNRQLLFRCSQEIHERREVKVRISDEGHQPAIDILSHASSAVRPLLTVQSKATAAASTPSFFLRRTPFFQKQTKL